MQPSNPVLRGLDKLAIAAIAMHNQTEPVKRISNEYAAMEVEEDALDDLAVTHRFARFSGPYERIEMLDVMPSIRSKPTRFVKTVRVAKVQELPPGASATMSLHRKWFEIDDHALATLDDDDDVPAQPHAWRWLAISLLAALVAVAVILAL